MFGGTQSISVPVGEAVLFLLSICPGLWKSRLDDQKETIMLPHSGEALPSQDWHSRM